MSAPETSVVLKDFFCKVTTSKTKERRLILSELLTCINKPDFPDNASKLIFKLLPLTLGHYTDSKSRREVEDIVRALLAKYGDDAVKSLLKFLTGHARQQRNIIASRTSGGSPLASLGWTCVLVHSVFNTKEKQTGSAWDDLIEAQCSFISAVLATNYQSLIKSACRKLKKVWKQVPDAVGSYAATLAKPDPTVHRLCMVSLLMQHCSQSNQSDVIDAHRTAFLDIYIKAVFGGKIKPQVHALKISKWLLCCVTHDEFKQKFLPFVQKAMLRSPENILEALSYLLSGVSLDLSQYAQDLGKNIATHLHAKEELLMIEAAVAAKNLAMQCSDGDAIQQLAKHFFAILNGSEGKLTIVTQRMGMLTGIGNLSYNSVMGHTSVHALASSMVEMFIVPLQQEVHEGTLVHTLSMLALWCAKFTSTVPKKLIDWFQKGMTLKQSTSSVRNGYIQCMLAAFKGDTLLQALTMLPLLKQSVERAQSQSTLVSIVTEGLSSAYMLTLMYGADIEAESKLSWIWSVLVDTEKQYFVSERFLSSASEGALQTILQLSEKLLIEHSDKLKPGTERLYHQAIVTTLVHPSWKLRKSGQVVAKRLVTSGNGLQVARSLLQELRAAMATQKVIDPTQADLTNGESGTETRQGISAVVLASALQALIVNAGTCMGKEDAGKLVLEALIDVHQPTVASVKPLLWSAILHKLKLDAVQLLTDNLDDVFEAIVSGNSCSTEASSNAAAATIARLAPKQFFPVLVNHAQSCLGNPDLALVTQEEYDIMKTPEGELFNKAFIERMASEKSSTANMKRENKAYSFKEQKMEIELQKEMEAKKRAKGIKIEVKLTKKQQEAKDAELAKESAIRKRLEKLDQDLSTTVNLLHACARGCPSTMAHTIPTLVPCLLSLVSSPLAASQVTEVFLALRRCVFKKNQMNIGDTVAYCTLRLSSTACPLDPSWRDEDIISMASRAVEVIHAGQNPTAEVNEDDDDDLSSDEVQLSLLSRCFPAPTLAYCFPLLNHVLRDGGSVVKKNEEVIEKALDILSAHAQLRCSEDLVDEVDENGPELLPRREMLELLTRLIGISGPSLQQTATSVLVYLCHSASGLPGCTMAEQDEIDVLLSALQSSCMAAREAALMGLKELNEVLPTMDSERETALNLSHRVLIAKHDPEESVKLMAGELWDEAALEIDPDLCSLTIVDVIHSQDVVRQSAALALAALLEEYRKEIEGTLSKLFSLHQDKLLIPPPVMDSLGRVISESPPDEFSARCGIANALGKISPYLKKNQVSEVFRFFVPDGLNDRNEEVRRVMLQSATAVIDNQGKDSVVVLLPVFEKFLDEAPNTSSYDAVRHSVVILMGSLAKHLDKTDPKVKPIVAKLIEALSTPSQQVQEAVANCLPPLVPAIKADAPAIVKNLLALLLESENYGERKGAAYGLAGLVKGLGILSLKQLDIMSSLQDAIQDKKNFRRREGALFAFEMLCNMLGRLFEPYVVHVLPHLLLCFGDGNQYVREAADDTAKAVMSKLSGHGVKLVLPSLLAALEEDSWRTKTGSVELLGAMAYCAPKQLSSCLPSIVPKLMEVLTDSHSKVQKAGSQALKQIGAVIRNPEIQAIVPMLLDALSNPSKKTDACLQLLLGTKFVHFIDAPSLALIMPVVQRSFQDRSTDTKKMAAQIIGNMYSLTDQKDLAPYLPSVMPGLKASLLDPVPEVRKVSARALGAMVKGMGESSFDNLLPWLMEKLTVEQNSVDRSGAAQGLSEVMAGMGVEKLAKLMPDIIKTAEAPDIPPHVRDGYIMMFIYLPGTFGERFTEYVGKVIPAILKALADESEFVRDTALRAGQRIVHMFAETTISVFLPELEKGLFDENWRIRYSSVQLLGDLLYRVSGVTGKQSTVSGEDDNFGTEHSTKSIIKVLGIERRNRVLAGLYMGRSDTALMVRQAALHVWKVVVVNTPRSLREILPTLFGLLLGCLASTSYDKRQVAARTLGDLVRKLGDRVLPDIIPILEKGLESEKSDQRQGVCVGLSEIMSSTSREQVMGFVDNIVPTVRKALCDPLPEVRETAAKTFDNLHGTIGHRALDDILPELLRQLDDEKLGPYALDGLKQVMMVKSRVVLPFLIPKLIQPPVNTRVLAILSEVAGEALTKHLSKILPALMDALKTSVGTPQELEELQHCQTVVLSVKDEQGLQITMDEIIPATKSSSAGVRRAAATLLYVYCSQTKVSFSQFVPGLLRALIFLMKDDDRSVLDVTWDALNAVTKSLTSADQLQHISSLRLAIRYAADGLHNKELPGFCLPKKGISPILPIFREALLNGPQDLKEQAASGLGQVIKLTSNDALKSQVVNITGPLIRVLGDRYTWTLKVAILQTLTLLLGKVGVLLKPFLPQLQTTFLRALSDPNRSVRLEAASALSKLVVIHARVDPLFVELHNGIKNEDNETGVRETLLQAVRGVVRGGGKKMNEANRKAITATLVGLLSLPEDTARMAAAGCVGALCPILPDDELDSLIGSHLVVSDPSAVWVLQHGRCVALAVAIKEAPQKLLSDKYRAVVLETVLKNVANDRIPVCVSGLRAVGFFGQYLVTTGEELPTNVITILVKNLNHSANDIKMTAAQMITLIAKATEHPLGMAVIKPLVIVLVSNTKDKNTAVQADSEIALVALLRLRENDSHVQQILKNLDAIPSANLNDCMKRLRKVANQPEQHFEADDTVMR
ncbi:eIF-2-alpha kinase activator GCN1-like [Asterias rubens]|uniref:eIF-2-alpha kinase activator GCN1-like n=1 Tax=Asterias rubens TaxID=7604 RepID=UPI0014550672|nr:eIF-2-alpha kinase activator GCN1-like [Asterias rubens]